MRQPTFARSKRRTRQQRLLRTGIGVVVLIGIAALIGNLIGDDGTPKPGEPATPQVRFAGTVKGETDAGSSLKPKQAKTAATNKEGAAIHAMLDDWYRQAFVDPERFGDGTFPTVRKLFTAEAATKFPTDVNTLTIGEARIEVSRVEPETSTADVTVYFDGSKPTFATADIRFVAKGTLKKGDAFPIRIVQSAVLHLRKLSEGWRVTWYDAKQTQDSIVPSPTATATSS